MPLSNSSNNRADEIRRRRMVQSHAAQSTTRKSVNSPAGKAISQKTARRRTTAPSAPPVMARNTSQGASRPTTRRSKSGRRLHHLTLGAIGAEMSLPSAPRLRLSWKLASFIMLAVLGAALYYLWTAPEFSVETAEINGLKRLTRGDVNRELALRNQPVFALDSGRLEVQLLEAFPEFSNVQVTIDFPNTVAITVTERVPVMIWKQDGRTILVDGDGKTFQARDEVALDALPVIESAGDPPPLAANIASLEEEALTKEEEAAKEYSEEVFQEFTPTEMFTKSTVDAVLQLSTQLPQNSTLSFHPVHGFGWWDGRGWSVYFGDLSRLDAKLNAYRAILEQVKTAGGTPEIISVESLVAPYYRVQDQQEQEQ